jgi:predicted glycoside hydrolase/deacetylase ChbG (UPF0249 family)
MRVIVNADDLGLSPTVNDAVFGLMGAGAITSATMLAVTPGVEEAARRVREFPACSFGVHLCLTEFRPLTGNPGLAPLLADGVFDGQKVREIPITPSLREAVADEWSAQVQRIIDLGVCPSHLDSHHHVHTVPGLFGVLKRVQKRFGIRKVRVSLTVYSPDEVPSRRLLARKALWNAALRWWGRTTTTRDMTSLAAFLDWAKRGRRLATRSIELMSHPGHPSFEFETARLHAGWHRELPFPVDLINYNEL